MKQLSNEQKEFLKEHCEYCHITGQISAKQPVCVAVDDRKTAKYFVVCFGNQKLLAHRVCWLLVTGEMPLLAIDHINGNGLDNRMENLRLTTQAENMRNKQRYTKPSVRFPGITIEETARGTAYRAQVGVNGRCKHGPTRYDLAEAVNDRIELLNQHGYSKRHIDAHIQPLLQHIATCSPSRDERSVTDQHAALGIGGAT